MLLVQSPVWNWFRWLPPHNLLLPRSQDLSSCGGCNSSSASAFGAPLPGMEGGHLFMCFFCLVGCLSDLWYHTLCTSIPPLLFYAARRRGIAPDRKSVV